MQIKLLPGVRQHGIVGRENGREQLAVTRALATAMAVGTALMIVLMFLGHVLRCRGGCMMLTMGVLMVLVEGGGGVVLVDMGRSTLRQEHGNGHQHHRERPHNNKAPRGRKRPARVTPCSCCLLVHFDCQPVQGFAMERRGLLSTPPMTYAHLDLPRPNCQGAKRGSQLRLRRLALYGMRVSRGGQE